MANRDHRRAVPYKINRCQRAAFPRSSGSSGHLDHPDDQRLQALTYSVLLRALLEGAAGFGAPVAITGALLVGLASNRYTRGAV
ncbi:L-lactate permease [Escherichia coli]